MALKLFPIPFPVFTTPPNPRAYPTNEQNPSQPHQRLPTEVRSARWNNTSAEKFNERRLAHQEIEEDIRRSHRFTSATNRANRRPSIGRSSSTSVPSIPGRKSKYSKPETPNSHPAFRRISKITNIPQPVNSENAINRNANINVSEDGLSYVINGAPFEFKYSYTETPKVKPLKLREPPFSPFGPTTMPRPWTGRPPLTPSKKKLKEFDSFQLPPPNKKGVKPVQAPGPFLPGSGPRYVKTREEILGEPLTPEEVTDLVNGCVKTNRQLNMGRDGFTHNMLDNIHAHWKRRRVCKIKCKGVCTVDMDNVCQELEEKTGGKIIYRKGGVLYLFRGRNYNYRTRPYFPIMLWKPVTPVYPRLIQRAPEGLTLEEAAEMRKKGRTLTPIRKLGKNGVYSNLVKNVREAFEMCELVRINCHGLNSSDYRKIGAKLRELVPCVLISFDQEHILMWRGRDWKSSFIKPENDLEETKGSNIDNATSTTPYPEDREIEMLSIKDASPSALNLKTSAVTGSEEPVEDISASSTSREVYECKTTLDNAAMNGNGATLDNTCYAHAMPASTFVRTDTMLGGVGSKEILQDLSEGSHNINVQKTMLDDGVYSPSNESGVMSNVCGSEAMLDNTRYANETTRSTVMGADGGLGSAESTEMLQDGSECSHHTSETKTTRDTTGSSAVNEYKGMDNTYGNEAILDDTGCANEMEMTSSVESNTKPVMVGSMEKLPVSEDLHDFREEKKPTLPCVGGVLRLREQAVESGSAVVLVDENLDADTIYQRSVSFSRSAPPGPVFRHRHRKAVTQKCEEQENGDLEVKEVSTFSRKVPSAGKTSTLRRRTKEFSDQYLDAVPQGILGVDELAKLLS